MAIMEHTFTIKRSGALSNIRFSALDREFIIEQQYCVYHCGTNLNLRLTKGVPFPIVQWIAGDCLRVFAKQFLLGTGQSVDLRWMNLEEFMKDDMLQVTLRMTESTSNVVPLFNNSDASDVQVQVGESDALHLHQCVLCTASPIFKEFISSFGDESMIIIDDFSVDTVLYSFSYIYNDPQNAFSTKVYEKTSQEMFC